MHLCIPRHTYTLKQGERDSSGIATVGPVGHMPYQLGWVPHQLAWVPHQLAWVPHQLAWVPHQLAWVPHQLGWVPTNLPGCPTNLAGCPPTCLGALPTCLGALPTCLLSVECTKFPRKSDDFLISFIFIACGGWRASMFSLVPSHSPKRTEGGRVWVHRLNFWVVLALHFRFLNYQSDPPDCDRSQELQWYQSREYIVCISSFSVRLCVYSLNHMSELAQVWRQDADTIHYLFGNRVRSAFIGL